MRVRQVAFVVPLGIAFALATSSSFAQSWPQRSVRVLVPNPPGVGIDIVTRLYSERLSRRWGKPVVVENVPGADGTLAAREFVSKRDDHTLMYSFPGLITINPLMYDKLPYDPDDLAPIASASDNFLAIAISESLKIGTIAEFLEAARTRATRLNWASTP